MLFSFSEKKIFAKYLELELGPLPQVTGTLEPLDYGHTIEWLVCLSLVLHKCVRMSDTVIFSSRWTQVFVATYIELLVIKFVK